MSHWAPLCYISPSITYLMHHFASISLSEWWWKVQPRASVEYWGDGSTQGRHIWLFYLPWCGSAAREWQEYLLLWQQCPTLGLCHWWIQIPVSLISSNNLSAVWSSESVPTFRWKDSISVGFVLYNQLNEGWLACGLQCLQSAPSKIIKSQCIWSWSTSLKYTDHLLPTKLCTKYVKKNLPDHGQKCCVLIAAWCTTTTLVGWWLSVDTMSFWSMATPMTTGAGAMRMMTFQPGTLSSSRMVVELGF